MASSALPISPLGSDTVPLVTVSPPFKLAVLETYRLEVVAVPVTAKVVEVAAAKVVVPETANEPVATKFEVVRV